MPEEGTSDGATGRQETVRQEAQDGSDSAKEGACAEVNADYGRSRSAEAEGVVNGGGEEGCGEAGFEAVAGV